jgi:uncharacterized protein (DUF2225 family)
MMTVTAWMNWDCVERKGNLQLLLVETPWGPTPKQRKLLPLSVLESSFGPKKNIATWNQSTSLEVQ